MFLASALLLQALLLNTYRPHMVIPTQIIGSTQLETNWFFLHIRRATFTIRIIMTVNEYFGGKTVETVIESEP
jgi:hypothetical protein